MSSVVSGCQCQRTPVQREPLLLSQMAGRPSEALRSCVDNNYRSRAYSARGQSYTRDGSHHPRTKAVGVAVEKQRVGTVAPARGRETQCKSHPVRACEGTWGFQMAAGSPRASPHTRRAVAVQTRTRTDWHRTGPIRVNCSLGPVSRASRPAQGKIRQRAPMLHIHVSHLQQTRHNPVPKRCRLIPSSPIKDA